jgi:hypothetical protein
MMQIASQRPIRLPGFLTAGKTSKYRSGRLQQHGLHEDVRRVQPVKTSSLRFGGKLHDAVGKPEQLEALLARQTEDVNEAEPVNGDTALHRLLRKEFPDPKSLKLLLGADADVNRKNRRGETPLHCLMDQPLPSQAALELLLEAGAGVNKRDRAGYTPLHAYLLYPMHSASVLEQLLDAGADPNVPNRDGLSPLHRLLTQETPNIETAKVLLEHGAKIKHAADGRLLLMTALKQKDPNLLLLILKSGFRLHRRDKPKHPVPERLLADRANYGLLRKVLGKRTDAFIFRVLTREVEPDMAALLQHPGQSGKPSQMAKEVAKTAFDIYT